MSTQSFLDDIHAQPETLARVCEQYATGKLRERLRQAAEAIRASRWPVCLTGMGASYFALAAVKASLDRGGVQSRLEDTAYLAEYGYRSIRKGQPVILVSQSGRTGEAIALTDALRGHSPLIVVTNDPETQLAGSAEFTFPLLAVPDGGVALKTYTASVALLLMLVAEICGGSAAKVAKALLAHDNIGKAIARSERNLDAVLEFVGASKHTTLLGRGPSIASALGGALLIKETAKLYAEGMNAGQFRHGAIEVIRQRAFVVLFAPQGHTHQLNLQLSAQLEAAGARVLLVGPATNAAPARRFVMEIDVPDEYSAPVFEIVPLQFLSHGLAVRHGIQPGTFVNTTPVVLTR
jgi:glucosamine--fructose-6-phosphate aminotransferase (isomerizing)